MRILLDTNVIINILTRRDDKYTNESLEIMRQCSNGSLVGYVAFHSLSTISYVFRKLPFETRLAWMKLICETLTIACSDNLLLLRAFQNEDFIDIEDNLQDCCAQSVNADYIVTANVGDYYRSVVPALTPKNFMVALERHQKACSAGVVESDNISSNESISLKNADKPVLHRISIQVIHRHYHHILEFAS